MVRGPVIDVREWRSFTEWDRDFDGRPRDWTHRGAYARERGASRWSPRLERKPMRERTGQGRLNATISSLTRGVRIELPPTAKTTYCLPLYS